MAWQQRLDAVKATRVDRTTVVGLIIGILLGLALGLLIGWVWWPVEWQGTDVAPAAASASDSAFSGASQFDTAETRALYLGATADAFVLASSAGSRDAAAVAAQRLAMLGGDLRGAFAEAIAFYRAQAGGAPQVSNLATLATAVGIPLDAGGGTAGTDAAAAGATADLGAATAPQAETAGEAATGATLQDGATTQAQGGNPLGWLLALLAAALLIGGGLYLLWALNRRQALEGGGSTGAFDAEEISASADDIVPAFDRTSLSPLRAGVTPAASVRSTVERPVAVEGRHPDGFEAENDEDIYPPHRTVTAVPSNYATALDEEEEEPAAAQGGTRYDDADAADYGDEGYSDDEWPEDEVGKDPTTTPDSTEPAQPGLTEPPSARTNVPGTSVRTTLPPTLQPPTPSRHERFTTIDSYTATYYLGQVDFDQGKPIGAPDGEGYLGEYSVGIPQKNGLLDHDMEKPIAMEVVLFDKSDGRTTLTTTRVLLSDYAHDHQYEEYQRANPNLAPIVAQPNTHFQLEGKQLLLDCLIREVNYTREGFFQRVVLELVVKRRV